MVPDPGPGQTLPEEEKRTPKLLVAFVVPMLFLATVAWATEPRNAVRERRAPTPPLDVTLRHDGAWLMPCSATPDTRPCPVGVVCLYRRVQDGPDGFPTSIVREDCLTEEIIQPMARVESIIDTSGEHCLLDEDRCTEVAQNTCRQAAHLPPGTRIRLVKKTFEMGRECTWTCPDGTKYSCSAPPQTSAPSPEHTAGTLE